MCVFCFSRIFLFFRGGSDMVAFRAKVDGKWQALFHRCLRYRVAGLRPSGFSNLPFSLFLSFPPFSSASLPFSHSFSNFPSFHSFSLFPSFLLPFFPQCSSNVPAIFLHLLPLSAFSPVFFGLVSNVHHEAQDTETNAACCERGFCMFLCIFGHIQKKGPD